MNQYENLLSKAKVAYAGHKYDEALNLAKGIIQFNSSQTEPYIIIGNVYLLKNKYGDAKNYYQKAIQLDSENGEYYFLLGNAYFGEGDFTTTIECYAKAESLGCSDEVKQKIYYIIGNLNQVSGKSEEALINYQKAGEIKGNNEQRATILLNQIEIYVDKGDYQKAEIAARSLKMIAPNDFNNYHLLFQVLLQLRNFDDALGVLNEAQLLFNDQESQIEMIFDRALLNVYKADESHDNIAYDKAIQELDCLDQMTSKKDIIYEKDITKSEILIRLDRLDIAMEILEKIANDEDQDYIDLIERARLTLMNCYMMQKNYLSAIIFARKIKESDNLILRHNGYYYEALIVKELSKSDETKVKEVMTTYQLAIAYFRNASASNPNDIVALAYRAKSYCDIGLYEKAYEIANILPDDAQKTIEEYIRQQGGDV